MNEIFAFLRCRTPYLVGVVLTAAMAGGCATSSAVTDVIASSTSQLWGASAEHAPPQLSGAFRYLRVDVKGRAPAYLTLGAIEKTDQGEVQVWFSSQREVIKLQHGRIVGTAGLETDWSNVRYANGTPEPGHVSSGATAFTRTRDVMPGYHYGVAEQLRTEPWLGAPGFAPIALRMQKEPSSFQWFREFVVGAGTEALPNAWFGMVERSGKLEVAYSHQCLSAALCLHIQPWPTAGDKRN